MLSLFDMMTQAQNGAAMDALSKQFNLAQEQAAQAMAALAPAFSLAFKRLSADPYGMSSLMQSLTSGDYAKYFEDVNKAFTPEGLAKGNAALSQVFGSEEVAAAIAKQAAEMTGIGQEVMRAMLPAIADLLMGGIFKQMGGQMGVAGNPFLNSTMTETLQTFLQGIGLVPKRPAPASIFDNPFTQSMQGFFTQAGASATRTAAGDGGKPGANPFFDNPMLKAFEQMMSPPVAKTTTEARPKEKSEPADQAPEASAQEQYRKAMNAMFDSGLEVRRSYERSIEAILETYRPKQPGA